MPRKKQELKTPEILPSAPIQDQLITDTIEKNFMPYAMSVIVSRAIPDIDGFKPSHRKLLYTMYNMNLLKGERTKSANVVGATMKLNPHGDQAIYATLARLTRANESLLHPLIDSKGAFGKHYSADMDCAAPRYTECKLDKICEEIFGGIDRDAVDMVENYDGSMTEPTLLPTSFPNVLVNPNLGVAVGMASNICSFNLNEICDGTIKLLKNPKTDNERLMDIILAPDFPYGGEIVYERDKYAQIFETGRGSVRVRARYKYDKQQNCIDVFEIPYTTNIEAIIDRVVALTKEGKIKEITDIRDEIDLKGFKMTIDLRRGTDPDKLMLKLFRLTTLEDSFDCNFNILVDGTPRQMGIKDILLEWINFRRGCVKRDLTFQLGKKREKLNLLTGLGIILLDIDKAIKIIRETKLEKDVIPNLMAGFGLNKEQAEYVAEIKLRNINREYIINRIKELDALKNEIAELEKTIGSEVRLNNLITEQLTAVKKKYGKERRSMITDISEIEEYDEANDLPEDFNVRAVFTSEGYFKKITLQSYRGNDEQKLKENDYVVFNSELPNSTDLFFFTDKSQLYRAKIADFDPCKAASLGDYVPAKLKFDIEDEKVIGMYAGNPDGIKVCFFFENGKAVKLPMSLYETKSNRRKLTGVCSAASRPVGVAFESAKETPDVFVVSEKTAMLVSTEVVTEKATKSSQGATLISLKNGGSVLSVISDPDFFGINSKRYRKNKVPSSGITLDASDIAKLPQKSR
ncbi:MAG: topoisomerase IV [Firmicutes bacterium]|nr:topoisomerase IV [Candidatus Colimorpha enterica]